MVIGVLQGAGWCDCPPRGVFVVPLGVCMAGGVGFAVQLFLGGGGVHTWLVCGVVGSQCLLGLGACVCAHVAGGAAELQVEWHWQENKGSFARNPSLPQFPLRWQ